MSKFINPFTDFGFHRIFGQEMHKELLIDFLNQLLEGERHIVDISFQNPNLLPDTAEDRGVIFDIYCKSDDGSYFITEMQNGVQPYFYDRGLYYMARSISAQGEKGKEWKFKLYPVYGVFLLNYKMGTNSRFRTDVILADRDTGKMFNDKMRQIYLELPWFEKEWEECCSDFERWLYLLKNMETLKRMPYNAQKAVWEKLLDVADVASLNKEERARYDEALKRYRDYTNTIDYAEEKGILKGKEEGIKEGMEKGMQKGIRAVAQNMKKKGFDTESIIACTGLDAETITKL